MTSDIRTIQANDPEFPADVTALADAPRQLYVRGASLAPLLKQPCVAIVGSRKVTAYGKAVTLKLAEELAHRGVVIVSGLAIGVDGLAHRAALNAGGTTVAVLPCDLQHIHPANHRQLAEDIVAHGGALLSEYPPGAMTYKLNFIARNRIVAALSNAVVVTEAAAKSGTLHTARFALEQGKDVLAVPGNITSETSHGTNNLIKSGAGVVTSAADILHVLGLATDEPNVTPHGRTPEEQLILSFLASGVQDGNELLTATNLDAAIFNQTLTMLELRGVVRALGANRWTAG